MTYFLCNLLEKRYVIFIISWHCSLGGNFLADTLRYLSWPALSRSWHLAASGMRLGVMSHQAGLLTTLHHIHICFPEQGGNMVTTMGWGFSDFRHLFCFTLMMNKACTYDNHIPLMYMFNSPANECWVSFSWKRGNPLKMWNISRWFITCNTISVFWLQKRELWPNTMEELLECLSHVDSHTPCNTVSSMVNVCIRYVIFWTKGESFHNVKYLQLGSLHVMRYLYAGYKKGGKS